MNLNILILLLINFAVLVKCGFVPLTDVNGNEMVSKNENNTKSCEKTLHYQIFLECATETGP